MITALYIHTIHLSDLLFAEIPFALLTVLFVLVQRRGRGWRTTVTAGLLGAAAYLTRAAGIALLVAWVSEALVQRRWGQVAARAGLALVPVVAWQVYTAGVKSGEEYAHPAYPYQRADYMYYNVGYVENILLVDPFAPELGRVTPRGLAARVTANLVNMPAYVGRVFIGGTDLAKRLSATRSAAGRLAAPGPLGPLFGPVRRRVHGPDGPRDLRRPTRLADPVLRGRLPGADRLDAMAGAVQPLLSAPLALPGPVARPLGRLVGQGLRPYSRGTVSGDWGWARSPWSSRCSSAGVSCRSGGLFAFLHTPTFGAAPWGGHRLLYYGEDWARFDEALDWLKEHGEPDAIVATTSPHWVYLKTGLKAVMVPMEADPAKAQELLDAVPVDYLIIDTLSFLDIIQRYGRPVVQKYPALWEPVYTGPGGMTTIYRRSARGRPTPRADAPAAPKLRRMSVFR